MRTDILQSWRRTEGYGIDVGLLLPRSVLSADALQERCARDEGLNLALPILRDFEHQIGDHVLAYFDAEGWLLFLGGDHASLSALERINFRPGVSWAETSAGTNGPGTALATGEPIEVFASEHLVAAWQLWSCAAAPILAPDGVPPLGLVDVTALWDKHSRQAINVAKALAQAVADRLGAARSLQEEAVRQALRAVRENGDSILAVNAAGRVIGRNETAVWRRILADGTLPAVAREALASAFFSPLASGDEAVFTVPEGSTFHAYAVRHRGSPVGAILRVVAPGSRSRATRTPSQRTVRYRFDCILGRSESLRHAVALARATASNDLPVVLTGESGTGKELFAQSIHAASGRASGPFVAVNCGSIPPHLVEAELFGYEPGAFTGGKREGSSGRFEDADGGTLLLDEVSELASQAQTALLRLLQEREVVRIGGSAPRRVDVRIVAATNKRLEEEVLARRFRRDLYYRLNVLPIALPPLRERGGDISLLAQTFLAEAAKGLGRPTLAFDDDAVAALLAHRWPGNIRELKNVVLRAAATAPHLRLGARDLAFDPDLATTSREAPIGRQAAGGTTDVPGEEALLALGARRWLEVMLRELKRAVPGEAGAVSRGVVSTSERPSGGHEPPLVDEPRSQRVTLREALTNSERDRVLEALDECGWNFGRAARRLGVARSTFYRLLHKNHISRQRRRDDSGASG
ncbi:MAG TPA: sigma 54-interacting transcriptional regulator [Anaeromyxobacteraceae bacterium]|nr:sigma 54-interacting transcriptional regulator [Anaeromyxobacteraceae bacterium]